jgi:O-methyltransferase
MIKNFLKKIIPANLRNGYRLRNIDLNDYYLLPKSQITYANDLLYTYHNCDFIREPNFAKAYALCKEIGGDLLKDYDIQWRIHVLCWAAKHASQLPGDFVDCGVNTGFCPRAVISYTNFGSLPKTYYLLDTFSGMDARYSSAYELERNHKLGYDTKTGLYEQAMETFAPFKNVRIVKGPIPDTLPEVKTDKVAYLSIDMNCVKPEVDAMEYFWDKMVSGGIIIMDDYGYPGCIDQKRAHDAFAASKGVEVLSLPTCQGIILKP